MIAFDTNVLAYAVDTGSPERQAEAERVVETALASGVALIPMQVLAEFQHVVVRKFGIRPAEALFLVESWSAAAARVEAYGLADVRAAAAVQKAHKIPLWDALIWAVCERAGVRTLVTQDFQDGRTLGRVTFVDPFNPANAERLGLASA